MNEITSNILTIESLENDDYGRVGLVDVRFHIRGEGFGDVHAVIDLRAYFTDASMPFEQIIGEAPYCCLKLLSHLVELAADREIPEGLQQRWKL